MAKFRKKTVGEGKTCPECGGEIIPDIGHAENGYDCLLRQRNALQAIVDKFRRAWEIANDQAPSKDGSPQDRAARRTLECFREGAEAAAKKT